MIPKKINPIVFPFESEWTQAFKIDPPFPQWQKSFVSGSKSTLFKIEHRIITRESLQPAAPLLSVIQYLEAAVGPPGHVHGGANAGLIDELMGILAWHHGYPTVTENLTLSYLRPVPLSATVHAITWLENIDLEQVKVHCALTDASQLPGQLEAKILISATGVFHRLTHDQLERFKQSLKK